MRDLVALKVTLKVRALPYCFQPLLYGHHPPQSPSSHLPQETPVKHQYIYDTTCLLSHYHITHPLLHMFPIQLHLGIASPTIPAPIHSVMDPAPHSRTHPHTCHSNSCSESPKLPI
ncbi:hypothetical protein E2C01_053163 [Portunus trituberculatus]|uniref:Uncharacterized protein n=1 Tax=Portunus trituberculatus TaxID=210409 RepID=A0A5B7GQ24_PORTR|nr:hypothetical protein [Portunus trituberculatus]